MVTVFPDGTEVNYQRPALRPTTLLRYVRLFRARWIQSVRRVKSAAAWTRPKPDTDGDGVLDGLEDKNLDGTVNATSGETDPRLWDTDGDGGSDKHRIEDLPSRRTRHGDG